GRPQAEVDLQVLDEVLWLQGQRLDRPGDLWSIARVLVQPPPLLDDGARQRLGEAPLRQHDLARLAATGLACKVLGDQRQLDPHASPQVIADLMEALAFSCLGVGAGKPQRGRRWALVRRPRSLFRSGPSPSGRRLVLLGADPADAALGRDDAIVVLDFE